jgi:hypothetical protein
MRGRPPDALEEGYNCVIDRDGITRRRWALAFRQQDSETIPGPPNMTVTERLRNPSNGTETYDVRPLFQWGFFYSGDKVFLKDASYTMSFNALVCQGVKIRMFNGDGITAPLLTELGATNFTNVTVGYCLEANTFGWDMYNAGPTDFELVDSSTPDDTGGYQQVWICNGKSNIQIWSGPRNMVPIALTGADPLTLETISRADFVRRFRDTMFYHTPEWPNHLFYSRPLTSGGFQDFDESGDAYWLLIDSGVDNPIKNAIRFGDHLYVFTPRSTWRVAYGNNFSLEWLMNVGCPSRRGMAIIGGVGGGSEQVAGPGNLIFMTYDRTLMVSDGVSATDMSAEVRPVLDELTDVQRDSCIVYPVSPLGTVLVLWPTVDDAGTDGLVFDTHSGKWIGEVHWDVAIDSIGTVLDAVHVGARGLGTLAENNSAALDGNHDLAGVVQLQADYPIDLAWRKYTAANTYFLTDGKAITQRLKTPDNDFGQPANIKKISNVFFDLDPYGKWDVTSQVWVDGKFKPIEKAISALDREMAAANEFVLGTTVAKPYRQGTPRGQLNAPAHEFAVGMSQEPGTTTDTDTTMWSGVTWPVANPGGFAVRSIQLHIDTGGPGMERTHNP